MPIMPAKLIIAGPSPFARKVRVAFREKDREIEEVIDNPWHQDSLVAQINPLGQVPLLQFDNGDILFDSRAILEWLEHSAPEPPLVPADVCDLAQMLRVESVCEGICDALVLTVLESARPSAMRSSDWLLRQQAKIENGLTALAGCARGAGPTVGNTFGRADIALGSMLGYLSLRQPENNWRANHRNLANFSDWVEQRPSFAQTRPVPQEIRPLK